MNKIIDKNFFILLIFIIILIVLIYFLIKNYNDYKTKINDYKSQISSRDKKIDENNLIMIDLNKKISDKSNVIMGKFDVTNENKTIFNLPAYFGTTSGNIDCVFIVSYVSSSEHITIVSYASYNPGVTGSFEKGFTIPENNKTFDVTGDGSSGNIYIKSNNVGNDPIKVSWTAIRI